MLAGSTVRAKALGLDSASDEQESSDDATARLERHDRVCEVAANFDDASSSSRAERITTTSGVTTFGVVSSVGR